MKSIRTFNQGVVSVGQSQQNANEKDRTKPMEPKQKALLMNTDHEAHRNVKKLCDNGKENCKKEQQIMKTTENSKSEDDKPHTENALEPAGTKEDNVKQWLDKPASILDMAKTIIENKRC